MRKKDPGLFLSLIQVLYCLVFAALANCFVILRGRVWMLIPVCLVIAAIHAFAGLRCLPEAKLGRKLCCHGNTLLVVFYGSMVVSVGLHLALFFQVIPCGRKEWLYSAIFCYLCHFLLFWNGIACVYLTSTRLGIKLRVLGAVLGWIPVVNLVVLYLIIRTTFREVAGETLRDQRNRKREGERLCATKYPLLLVHGVCYRDNAVVNYWGRIPKDLEANGARVYYGNHQSAISVAASARELARRIQQILQDTGCERVNIIAHSKGGLDCRYAMAHLGAAPMVASLTTINTPHRGCIFADWLLDKTSDELEEKVAATYNHFARLLGDTAPDFLAAMKDLTGSSCQEFDQQTPNPEGVLCQSVGSVLGKPSRGPFPLNVFYPFVKHFDGDNDGLVGESSFAWGESYRLLRSRGKRGISHTDMVDLDREDIPGFDVREFYVNLVAELKARGL